MMQGNRGANNLEPSNSYSVMCIELVVMKVCVDIIEYRHDTDLVIFQLIRLKG